MRLGTDIKQLPGAQVMFQFIAKVLRGDLVQGYSSTQSNIDKKNVSMDLALFTGALSSRNLFVLALSIPVIGKLCYSIQMHAISIV